MSERWFQRRVQLPAFRRGFHLVTRQLLSAMPEVAELEMGLFHAFLLHTSASLSINENADPDVRTDLERSLSAIAPESYPYVHTMEGPDDMPAHVKSALLGCSVTIPVTAGRLAMGTWQGIYLGEHRDQASGREVVVTLHGVPRAG